MVHGLSRSVVGGVSPEGLSLGTLVGALLPTASSGKSPCLMLLRCPLAGSSHKGVLGKKKVNTHFSCRAGQNWVDWGVSVDWMWKALCPRLAEVKTAVILSPHLRHDIIPDPSRCVQSCDLLWPMACGWEQWCVNLGRDWLSLLPLVLCDSSLATRCLL